MSPHKQSNAGFPDFPFRLLGGSPEWIAGMRLRPGSVVATVSALTLCACVPYAGFPALVAGSSRCMGAPVEALPRFFIRPMPNWSTSSSS